MSEPKLPNEFTDDRVTFREYQLMHKAAWEAAGNDAERTGEAIPEVERYGYGVFKNSPFRAAMRVLQLSDDPTWTSLSVAQSYLLGGEANEEALHEAVKDYHTTKVKQ